jgi:hypothetical protein
MNKIEEEFKFKKIRENFNNSKKTKESNRNDTVTGGIKKISNKKISNKKINKISNTTAGLGNETLLEFNVIKKRKTIQLDRDIDISSNSILVFQPNPIDEDPIDKNIKPLDKQSHPIDKNIINRVVKSGDIHKNVISSNVNDLIKECVYFLKDESKYSKEIIKHCNANYFSDIDFRKEIETNNNKVEIIKNEIKKWEGIYERELESNRNGVDLTEESLENVDSSIDLSLSYQKLSEEFDEKARNLQVLDEKLRYFFENAKEKSEVLLKNVFGSIEEKNVDALFLLKAMSKLGR